MIMILFRRLLGLLSFFWVSFGMAFLWQQHGMDRSGFWVLVELGYSVDGTGFFVFPCFLFSLNPRHEKLELRQLDSLSNLFVKAVHYSFTIDHKRRTV